CVINLSSRGIQASNKLGTETVVGTKTLREDIAVPLKVVVHSRLASWRDPCGKIVQLIKNDGWTRLTKFGFPPVFHNSLNRGSMGQMFPIPGIGSLVEPRAWKKGTRGPGIKQS
ncbi:hypothetical protein Tco_0845450, partial [Tanacetum coccineum]